jgi:hypothetical protein
MGNINPEVFAPTRPSEPIVERKSFIIKEPMAKINFFRVQPLPDRDEEMPI